jgi:hypothetical protein
MYTIPNILAAAGVTSESWSKGGANVRLTKANQLIGTYADLLRFVGANSEYARWEVHHILEALDVNRLNLGAFAPPYRQQICVLLPATNHYRINSILRRTNPTSDTVTIADLESAYRDAYDIAGNYCGSSEKAISKELYDIFRSVVITLNDAATKALNDQLRSMRDTLQKLQNGLAGEKALHETLIRDSSPSTLQTAGFVASLINPITLAGALVNPANRSVIGGAVNALNPKTRPGLEIWAKGEECLRIAAQALARSDLPGVIGALAKGEGYYRSADAEFTAWRDGIELAGRRAELVIGVSAAVAAIVAFGAFAAGALAATAATEAVAATETTTGVHFASELTRGVRVIVTASTAAEGQLGEAIIDGAVHELQMSLPSPL